MLFFIVLFRPVSRRDGSSHQTTQSFTLKPAYFCDDLHDFKIIAKTVRCLLENMFFSFFTPALHFSHFLPLSPVFLQTRLVDYIHMQLLCSSDLHPMAAFIYSEDAHAQIHAAL